MFIYCSTNNNHEKILNDNWNNYILQLYKDKTIYFKEFWTALETSCIKNVSKLMINLWIVYVHFSNFLQSMVYLLTKTNKKITSMFLMLKIFSSSNKCTFSMFFFFMDVSPQYDFKILHIKSNRLMGGWPTTCCPMREKNQRVHKSLYFKDENQSSKNI